MLRRGEDAMGSKHDAITDSKSYKSDLQLTYL